MAAKQLVFSEDARRKLSNGMNTVANAVGATLGAKGCANRIGNGIHAVPKLAAGVF